MSAGPLAGAVTALRLVLRRNGGRLLAWFAFVVGMFAYVIDYYSKTFTTQQSLDDFARMATSPGMRALTGVADDPSTLGGAVWTKIWMTLAIGLALGVVFLVTRNGRADEEAGRTELLRSRVLGLRATSAAAWAVIALLCLLSGLASAAVGVAMGLDPDGAGITGSLLFGLSVTGVGWVALGVAALTGEIASTGRGANAMGGAVIGVFYVVRVIADLGPTGLEWASPLGWAELVRPWGRENGWPLLLLVALAAMLLGIAWRLQGRRDLGAGMIVARPGRPHAPARWSTSLGLAVRLARGTLIGWSVVCVVAALMFGSVVSSMGRILSDAGGSLSARLGGSGTDALVAVLVRILALVVLSFALQSTLVLRADEAGGAGEAQLSRPMSRVDWVLGRLAVPVVGSAVLLAVSGALLGLAVGRSTGAGGQVLRLTGAALAFWPALMAVVGLAVLVFGWLPRWSTVLTWVLLAVAWLVEMLGLTLGLPERVLDVLPLEATPSLPQEAMRWTPLLVLAAVAAALVALGVGRFRSRDLQAA